MRFTLPILTILSASALASPSPLNSRDITTTSEVTKAIQFAAQAECSIFNCAAVIAAGGCIAAALALTGPAAPAGVAACVAGGLPSVSALPHF